MIYFSENRAVYEIMFKIYGTAGQTNDDSIIQRMLSACRRTKDTKTQSEHVILLFDGTVVTRKHLNIM
jgi:hypothetical protein